MRYILNPGDGHEVATYDTQKAAFIALEKAFAADHNFASLYSSDGKTLSRYDRGNWVPIERGSIQIKVLMAASFVATPERPSDASSEGQVKS